LENDNFIKLAYDRAINFRDKYKLGNYCAKQLLEVIDRLELSERINIKLIRTPFSNLSLAGFIGFKQGEFVIVTNTNKTLGSEKFTIAHEIYHLLEDRVYIKNNSVIEEIEDTVDSKCNDIKEVMANAFAAELLMPKSDIVDSVHELTKGGSKKVESITVIRLQQKYGVDYEAITKRLHEVNKITKDEQRELNEFAENKFDLEKMTKNLGYSNELNLPSKDTYLSQRDLELIKDNYDKGYISYDDLVRFFGYLGCEPEKFGYENNMDLTDDAKEFMKSLLN
jgi:Zn-dependent peptidase ImmA (M78 family)